jgi:hypothetical protein
MSFVEDLPEVGTKEWFAIKPGAMAVQENEQFVMWLLDLKLITAGDATRSYKEVRAIAAEKIEKIRESRRE